MKSSCAAWLPPPVVSRQWAGRMICRASFDKIMQALKAQWMIEAPVYPRKGTNNAVFNLTLKGGQG
jgi:hypothetical protein